MSVQEELTNEPDAASMQALPHLADLCGAGQKTIERALAASSPQQSCRLCLSAVSACYAGGIDGQEGSASETNAAAGLDSPGVQPGSPSRSLTGRPEESSSRRTAASIQTTPGLWGGINDAAQAAAVPQGGSTQGGSAGVEEAAAVPQSCQAQDSRARELERANKRAGLAWLQVRAA